MCIQVIQWALQVCTFFPGNKEAWIATHEDKEVKLTIKGKTEKDNNCSSLGEARISCLPLRVCQPLVALLVSESHLTLSQITIAKMYESGLVMTSVFTKTKGKLNKSEADQRFRFGYITSWNILKCFTFIVYSLKSKHRKKFKIHNGSLHFNSPLSSEHA